MENQIDFGTIKQCKRCGGFYVDFCSGCKMDEQITQTDKVYDGIFIDGNGCCPLCKQPQNWSPVYGWVCYDCGIIINYG